MKSIYLTEGHAQFRDTVRGYRDARVGTIVAGTSEIMREVIARSDIDKSDFAPGKPK